MKKIKLTKGQFALVDNDDFEILNKYHWQYNAKTGAEAKILMHRIVIKAPKDTIVDHIDRNRLNNKKSNLRLCTTEQNNHNTGMFKNNTSGYKGVNWNKREKVWKASITKNNKRVGLGVFKTAREAAIAYNNAVIKLRGEFGWLNKI